LTTRGPNDERDGKKTQETDEVCLLGYESWYKMEKKEVGLDHATLRDGHLKCKPEPEAYLYSQAVDCQCSYFEKKNIFQG
jgi:hypothetical protein